MRDRRPGATSARALHDTGAPHRGHATAPTGNGVPHDMQNRAIGSGTVVGPWEGADVYAGGGTPGYDGCAYPYEGCAYPYEGCAGDPYEGCAGDPYGT